MNPTAFLLLVLAIASEVAGTAGLKASEGFGRLGPSALAVLAYALAFYLLAQSLKYIPLGVVYAIWSRLGTIGLVLLGLLIWQEILGTAHVLGYSPDRGGRRGAQRRPHLLRGRRRRAPYAKTSEISPFGVCPLPRRRVGSLVGAGAGVRHLSPPR